MGLEVIVASIRSPSTVVTDDGAGRPSRWKCLARGSVMRSDLEAWDYAALPPGGIVGEHDHTRTDEVYFILGGDGEVMLDGERHRVGTGDAILNPLATRHGLVNAGDSDLAWLAIEMTHPTTTALLRGPGAAEIIEEEGMRLRPAIVNLSDGRLLEPHDHLSDRWRSLQIVRVLASESRRFKAGEVEHALYVLSGTGTARSVSQEFSIESGMALTLARDSEVEVTAADDGELEIFHVALVVG